MLRILMAVALFLLESAGSAALEIPKLRDRVTDLAGVLTPAQLASLDAKLKNLEDTDSTQIAVVVIPSLQGESLEDFSIRVAQDWRVGQKGRDNGAILFVAVQDRRMRIEVGYGLEPTLTDARSSQIIRDQIAPRFRLGDYYGGIDSGITAIIQTVRGVYQSPPVSQARYGRRPSGGLVNLIIMLLFPLFWILSATGKWGGGIIGAGAGMLLSYTIIGPGTMLLLSGGVVGALLGMLLGALVRAGAHSGRRTGGWGGPFFLGGGGGFGGFGGGGGGGFSGGGGGFGGGGSSGSW